MQTIKFFWSADAAVAWLSANSGLWAGLSTEAIDDLYEGLEQDGAVRWTTPMGDTLEAAMVRRNVRRGVSA